MTVTIRPGGATLYSGPDAASEQVGSLAPGAAVLARSLWWRDRCWLQIVRPDTSQIAWIVGEHTDFARSAAYTQVVGAWYESEPVLAFRRALLGDLLRARRAGASALAQVERARGDDLIRLEDSLARATMLPGYVQFWQLQERLRLPAPFEHLPVQPVPPARFSALEFNGFGPTTYAYKNWEWVYRETRGLHNGLDYVVPEGSPLIAVADGVIVEFACTPGLPEPSLALRPYLPERYRQPDGSRALSNMVVVYCHLTGDPTGEIVRAGQVVSAGQIIGTSGWPVYVREDGSVGVQGNNAHLHLETHLITDGKRDLGSRQPVNPLLFWTPRLTALQARLAAHSDSPPYPKTGQPFGNLGFFAIGCFRYDPPTIVWDYEPSQGAIWPEGVYDLDAALAELRTYSPYARDGGGLQ